MGQPLCRVLFCILTVTFFLSNPNPAWAFSPIGHSQITVAAIQHWFARANPASLHATSTLVGDRRKSFDLILNRAVVDLDFQTDVWGEVMTYGPVSGVRNAGTIKMFTSLLHFINVTKPGQFWAYDGFAYRNAWGLKNDQLFALPFSQIRTDLSPRLAELKQGFRGTDRDWRHLFIDSGNSKRAVFPPAYVTAELAYEDFKHSTAAKETSGRWWTQDLLVTEGLRNGFSRIRWYWEGQIEGFPSKIQQLGKTLHMAQDMAVPHHTMGTLDFCHEELEKMFDVMNCGRSRELLNYEPYELGIFDADLSCQRLYDPALVDRLLKEAAPIQANAKLTITERLIRIAQMTNHWQWGDPIESVNLIGTVLPNGTVFTADRCAELFRMPAIRKQIRLQFNFAIAITVGFLNIAFDDYLNFHLKGQQATPAR